jgi:hypothetical protein
MRNVKSNGEQWQQRFVEAELIKRRLQSSRFNMKGYSMNLRHPPSDDESLAVKSNKLVVKSVQSFKVLCPADNSTDFDEDMIENALLNFASSKRQKDRAPSSIILHRHLQHQNSQQFSLQQNTVVHQKLKGQNETEDAAFKIFISPQSDVRHASALPTIRNEKIALSPSILHLFDMDSSRSGRTNEHSNSVPHEDCSSRIEIRTPVKEKNVIQECLWNNAPGKPGGMHMPWKRNNASQKPREQTRFQASNPVLELAAPYSKNYVENYKSKIRHSRLGAMIADFHRESTHPSDARNSAFGAIYNSGNCDADAFKSAARNRRPQNEVVSSQYCESQRMHSADSNLVSSPSQESHGYLDVCETVETFAGNHICDSQEELEVDSFEVMEREHMLQQVQKMYSCSSMPIAVSKAPRIGSRKSMNRQQERRALSAGPELNYGKGHPFKNTADHRSLHVIVPHNEDVALAESSREHSEVQNTSLESKNIRPVGKSPLLPKNANAFQMSINILRPFESIVDEAQRCRTPLTENTKKKQHSTPIAVMFASKFLMQ